MLKKGFHVLNILKNIEDSSYIGKNKLNYKINKINFYKTLKICLTIMAVGEGKSITYITNIIFLNKLFDESLPSHLHELFLDIAGSWDPSVEFLLLVAFQLALSKVFSFDEGTQESSLHEEDCI